MSVIYPGNYVTNLNAYRGQGVYSIPGVEFYQAIGVGIVETGATGTVELKVLSPDLRQDDKPRLDREFKIPAGAVLVKTGINVVNATNSAATGAAAIAGLTGATTSVAAVATEYPASGEVDGYAFDLSGGGLGSEATVTANLGANTLTLVDTSSQGAVIVEVVYAVLGDAPGVDDINLPFKVEAGQGT